MSEESIQADWNMGMAYLQRVDKILTDIAKSRFMEDGRNHYRWLFNLRAEIYLKLNKEEREQLQTFLRECTEELKKLDYKEQTSLNLSSALDKAELFMRDCMEKHNLAIPNKEGRMYT